MQTVSRILPTTLSALELKSDERTFQFDEEAEIPKPLNECEDIRRLINETAQWAIRVDHIHNKTDQEIERLDKVIKEVTESNNIFTSCSRKYKSHRHFSDSESSLNTQQNSLSQLHGSYDRNWRYRINKWFKKNKSKLAPLSASDLEVTDNDKVHESEGNLLGESETPYSSDADDFTNGLNIISPLTPDDFDNKDIFDKIDETSEVHPTLEVKKSSISPTFGNDIKKGLLTDDTESIISEPPLRENKKTLLKYRNVRTSFNILGSEKGTSKNNSGMFRIFHRSSTLGDKNQENMPRVWNTVRNNLGREIYLLQERFKKWTAKNENSKKGQVFKDDAVIVPLSLADPVAETQLESKLCFMSGSEGLTPVQA
ncbi:hypothetical protein SMKI_16G2370 [Saccharomyces mikatae IFO 1815]|uniref:YPR078C-like protein n=1 Tax=Saccharomyces mikatae IFO 1815 TaxID=226126 RepID=A0AA35IU33_SACMI|nr:uncharacterized protein SMKI_16G2370 [Saccharomyces mikatae IFO 1815]CAI4036940.1 hypothetical protein SMKI_16G2370 [Saccharomyces mikatae IFO 1815]